MKLFANVFLSGALLTVGCLTAVQALDLVGSVAINQSSKTAAMAKNEAMNAARRQILFDVLSNYTEPSQLQELLDNSPDEDLVNLVASSGVSNEHMSTASYSANITMNIDNDAVKKWLAENDVKNWVPAAEPTESFSLYIIVPNGLSDWGELKQVAEKNKTEINTITVFGNQIFAKMPLIYRTKFTAGIREFGWKYADNGGVLQVWK